MPAPIAVKLVPHHRAWATIAQNECDRIRAQIGADILAIHHIGSTSIVGIHAKPIIDLLPVVGDVKRLDGFVGMLESIGYQYWGEYGIAGRRYCTFDDAATGDRRFQLHCFQANSVEVEKHLAFRDYLRADAEVAAAYDAEKRRCRDLHPEDSHAYSAAKSDWIGRHLPAAISYFRDQRQG